VKVNLKAGGLILPLSLPEFLRLLLS